MTSQYRQACVLAIFLFASAAAEAKLYKWVDANGETHYSETLPRGQKGTEVQSQPAPAPSNDAGTGNAEGRKQFEEQSESNRQRKQAEQEQSEAEIRRQNALKQSRCDKARRDLELLQKQGRIYSLGPNGEKIYMDDEARAANIEKAIKEASENCE